MAWLFADTPRGAETSAKLFGLIDTTKACGLDPTTHLSKAIAGLPQATTFAHLEALLPLASAKPSP